MNVVMIIPTGIGCEIGGHCGDGNDHGHEGGRSSVVGASPAGSHHGQADGVMRERHAGRPQSTFPATGPKCHLPS